MYIAQTGVYCCTGGRVHTSHLGCRVHSSRFDPAARAEREEKTLSAKSSNFVLVSRRANPEQRMFTSAGLMSRLPRSLSLAGWGSSRTAAGRDFPRWPSNAGPVLGLPAAAWAHGARVRARAHELPEQRQRPAAEPSPSFKAKHGCLAAVRAECGFCAQGFCAWKPAWKPAKNELGIRLSGFLRLETI